MINEKPNLNLALISIVLLMAIVGFSLSSQDSNSITGYATAETSKITLPSNLVSYLNNYGNAAVKNFVPIIFLTAAFP